MAQWGNNDEASNSVLWGVTGYNQAPNTANRDAFFGNNTADAYVTGLTVGQYGLDNGEVAAMRDAGSATPAHSGWNVRKEGSGGRAGRVTFETLVAMGSITGDAEDVVGVDYSIRFTTNPSSRSANSTNNDIATFSVATATVPTGGSVTYIWQKWNGSAFANLSNAGAYSNTTTATLSVLANTASNGEIYRARAAATGATAVFSSNAVITITT